MIRLVSRGLVGTKWGQAKRAERPRPRFACGPLTVADRGGLCARSSCPTTPGSALAAQVRPGGFGVEPFEAAEVARRPRSRGQHLAQCRRGR